MVSRSALVFAASSWKAAMPSRPRWAIKLAPSISATWAACTWDSSPVAAQARGQGGANAGVFAVQHHRQGAAGLTQRFGRIVLQSADADVMHCPFLRDSSKG